MAFKAILFDLDGTLLNTLDDIGDAANRVLATNGFPTHKMDAFRNFIGDGAAMLITRALPEGRQTNDTVRICLEAFKEDYGRNWNKKTTPYHGIPGMLDELTSRKLKMAVLSNKPHDFTQKCVTTLLANWKFDVVLGQRDHVPPKPDPAGALEVSERLNLPPENFLYLGDSAVDMKTAVEAGMVPVGVSWGYRPAEELKKSGCHTLIDQPMDVLEILA